MLVKTKLIINDLEIAIRKFDNHPIDQEFRLNLVLCLTLIRAIGNVIDNETKDYPNLRKLNDLIFKRKKKIQFLNSFLRNSEILF